MCNSGTFRGDRWEINMAVVSFKMHFSLVFLPSSLPPSLSFLNVCFFHVSCVIKMFKIKIP